MGDINRSQISLSLLQADQLFGLSDQRRARDVQALAIRALSALVVELPVAFLAVQEWSDQPNERPELVTDDTGWHDQQRREQGRREHANLAEDHPKERNAAGVDSFVDVCSTAD